jgi:hypothetical protein
MEELNEQLHVEGVDDEEAEGQAQDEVIRPRSKIDSFLKYS